MNLNEQQPVEGLLADLFHAILYPRGWNLLRVGDGEVGVLNSYAGPDTLGYGNTNNSVSPEAVGPLQEEFVAAYSNADWVGVFNDDTSVVKAFDRNKIPGPRQQTYAWVNRHLCSFRAFVDVLCHESLLLMGGPMSEWHAKCLSPISPKGTVEVFGGNCSPTTIAELHAARQVIEATKARIVIVSMGVWAKPLCHYAKQLGKIGLDFGHAASDMLGGVSTMNVDGNYGIRGYLEHWNKKPPRLPCLCEPWRFAQ